MIHGGEERNGPPAARIVGPDVIVILDFQQVDENLVGVLTHHDEIGIMHARDLADHLALGAHTLNQIIATARRMAVIGTVIEAIAAPTPHIQVDSVHIVFLLQIPYPVPYVGLPEGGGRIHFGKGCSRFGDGRLHLSLFIPQGVLGGVSASVAGRAHIPGCGQDVGPDGVVQAVSEGDAGRERGLHRFVLGPAGVEGLMLPVVPEPGHLFDPQEIRPALHILGHGLERSLCSGKGRPDPHNVRVSQFGGKIPTVSDGATPGPLCVQHVGAVEFGLVVPIAGKGPDYRRVRRDVVVAWGDVVGGELAYAVVELLAIGTEGEGFAVTLFVVRGEIKDMAVSVVVVAKELHRREHVGRDKEGQVYRHELQGAVDGIGNDDAAKIGKDSTIGGRRAHRLDPQPGEVDMVDGEVTIVVCHRYRPLAVRLVLFQEDGDGHVYAAGRKIRPHSCGNRFLCRYDVAPVRAQHLGRVAGGEGDGQRIVSRAGSEKGDIAVNVAQGNGP